MPGNESTMAKPEGKQLVKCLVWDLDNTLWQGTLVEDTAVSLRPEALELLETLDSRGILQSIASKNDYEPTIVRLKQLGIAHYFLYPEIHWNAKSSSIKAIAQQLNIALDSIAFVDDQPFEREEVRFHLPDVRTFDAANLMELAELPDFSPGFITDDAKNRRQLYQQDQRRTEAEKEFTGTNEDFLKSLEMRLQIAQANQQDLARLQELTQRTHQLNTTGLTFTQEELLGFISDPTHELLVVSLQDCFGHYGKIGIALLHKTNKSWRIRLLLLSCRVMSRGIGSALLTYLKNRAFQAGVDLHADFKSNDRNRMMYIAYKFAGFVENKSSSETTELVCSPASHTPLPGYLSMR